MLRFDGIAKSYGTTQALSEISFSVAPGTVHGVLGENGAGKSTLMQVLAGLVAPDAGAITLDNRSLKLGSPAAARRAGIGMVHQHFMQVPTLSVLDNLALMALPGIGVISRSALARRLIATAEQLQWQLDPHARVAALSVGERQRLEIVTALIAAGGTARVLVLDEPTAVLAPQEVDDLLPAVRRLAAAGTTVLFIGHKLHEVERVCDGVTILRRGRVVRTNAMKDTDRLRMTRDMMGIMPVPPAPRPAISPGAALIECREVSVTEQPTITVVHPTSFAVRAGEIVGIAGVDGNGQSALVETLIGIRAASSGTVHIAGQAVIAGSRPARLAVIPEDRAQQALIGTWSVMHNLVLGHHRRRPFAWGGWLRFNAWRVYARNLIDQFDVRPRDASLPVAALSGGNQQKIVVARELGTDRTWFRSTGVTESAERYVGDDAQAVVVMNPTRGLDVGASATVWSALEAARVRGAAVLLVHSDLDELLAVADRVLVCRGGRFIDSGWPACDRAHIGGLMVDADAADSATERSS